MDSGDSNKRCYVQISFTNGARLCVDNVDKEDLKSWIEVFVKRGMFAVNAGEKTHWINMKLVSEITHEEVL